MNLEIMGPASALMSSLTWAIGSNVYSKLSEKYPAFVINFFRALIALPFFLLASIFLISPEVHSNPFSIFYVEQRKLLWLALSTVASYGFADMLFFWSALRLGITGALALASLYPIWSALAAWIWKSQPLHTLQILGLICAVSGVVLVILSGSRSPLKTTESADTSQRPHSGAAAPPIQLVQKRKQWTGVALGLCTSILWALNTYAVAEGGREVPATVSSAWRMIFTLMIAPLIAYFLGLRAPIKISTSDLRKYGWVFIMESFGGSLFFVFGLVHSRLAVAAALSSLAPVLALPVARLIRNEKIPPFKIIGSIAVVVGICLLVSN